MPLENLLCIFFLIKHNLNSVHISKWLVKCNYIMVKVIVFSFIHACSTMSFVRTALPMSIQSLLFLSLLPFYSVFLRFQQRACHCSCPFTEVSGFCVPQARFQTTQWMVNPHWLINWGQTHYGSPTFNPLLWLCWKSNWVLKLIPIYCFILCLSTVSAINHHPVNYRTSEGCCIVELDVLRML